MLFYFTSTGNCLEVCKKIGGEMVSIPSVLKGDIFDFTDDTIGIVVPVYGGGIPKPVSEFLSKVRLNSKYIFGILTYGAISGNACEFLLKDCEKNAIHLDYVNSIIMVDNSFVYFDMEKQILNLSKKKVDVAIAKIKGDIERKEHKLYGVTPFRSLIGKLASSAGESKYADVYKNFFIEDSCNSCSTCVKLCPIGNISLENGKPVIHERCIRCGACYHNCPQAAIRYKGEKSKVQYRNRHVKLAEIISANSGKYGN